MAHNIADLFEHAVDLTPERTAVVCGERSLTFAELEARSNQLAHHFVDRGLGQGSHVGVCSRNSIEALETMLAAYKIRAVAVNINYRYVTDELRYLFEDADLSTVVCERRYAELVTAAASGLEHVRELLVVEDGADDALAAGAVEYESALSARAARNDFGSRSGDDLYLLYTGGTTGKPKGVMWRHEDIWRTLGGGIDFMTGAVLQEGEQAREGARTGGLVRLPAAPFIHGGAQWAALANLFSCGTVVCVPEFDPDEVWRSVQRNGVNVLFIVGDAMARPLLDSYRAGCYDASSLVAVASSAALLSPAVKEQFLETLPDVVLTDSIGSSETGFSGIGIATRGQEKAGGPRVSADDSTTVLDEDDRPAAVGVVGWLARTGHVPLGYYKDTEKTHSVFKEVDGKRYVVPGDYARIEEDGTIAMLGRGSVCVNTGGEKVHPEEVESAVKSHPDVFDALVVGVPDDRLGQRVVALVEPRRAVGPTLPELDAHVRQLLAGYKVPRDLWTVSRVHRSATGKPDYQWARQHVQNETSDTGAR